MSELSKFATCHYVAVAVVVVVAVVATILRVNLKVSTTKPEKNPPTQLDVTSRTEYADVSSSLIGCCIVNEPIRIDLSLFPLSCLQSL